MSIQELKKALKTEKINFGTNSTLKNLKKGKVKVVMIASNCSEKTKKDLEYYTKISKAKLIDLKKPSDEVALICKKNYSITVLSY